MKAWVIVGLCLLPLACTNKTVMIQDGNAWIQKTEEGGLFGKKVVHVKRCLPDDRLNGFCREHGEYEPSQVSLHEGPGMQLVSSLVTAGAIVGGTALLMHGMQTQAVSPGAQVLSGASISTINTCGTGPAFLGMKAAPGCK